MLEFDKAWRFETPGPIAIGSVGAFSNLIGKVAAQGHRQRILEHFKTYFASSMGFTSYPSSDIGWTETDLLRYMEQAADNAPLFIEAFYDACCDLKEGDRDISLPDLSMINRVLAEHQTGYQVHPPNLISTHRREQIAVPERMPSLGEQAQEIIRRSLEESRRLLMERRSRQAIQETLWLLETVSTAFKGLELENATVEGKYFNNIVRDLRRSNKGRAIDEILRWIMTLHGYLSSPTGGGIRHGIDLKDSLEVTDHEAELFCNLIRSYISFLLAEHGRLSSRSQKLPWE